MTRCKRCFRVARLGADGICDACRGFPEGHIPLYVAQGIIALERFLGSADREREDEGKGTN